MPLTLSDQDLAELQQLVLPEMRLKEANMLMNFLNAKVQRDAQAKPAPAAAPADLAPKPEAAPSAVEASAAKPNGRAPEDHADGASA